jgi:ABC-type sugar transport system ATPase subunit
MVFQNYALYHNMHVSDNILVPLTMRHVSSQRWEWKVAEAAKLFNIYDVIDKHVIGISGSQKQSVPLGRAMVRDPAFLLGEPLSNV